MKEQMEAENLSQAVYNEREDQIRKLEEQLSQAQEMAANNKSAANILTELMEKGDLVQQPDGSFNVASGANEIGNLHEQYD